MLDLTLTGMPTPKLKADDQFVCLCVCVCLSGESRMTDRQVWDGLRAWQHWGPIIRFLFFFHDQEVLPASQI